MSKPIRVYLKDVGTQHEVSSIEELFTLLYEEKTSTCAVVRYATDEHFLAADLEAFKRVTAKTEMALKLSLPGSSGLEVWNQVATFVDGDGWRAIYSKRQMSEQELAQVRAAIAAQRAAAAGVRPAVPRIVR